MTTKERIIKEALDLFSVKGFKGTSVKNIADAVGIKDSSLYKHFKSKQEIFDTIVLEMRNRMESTSAYMGLLAESDLQAFAKMYEKLSLKELQDISRHFFLFYLKDEFVSKFWRMANIERYQNSTVYTVYNQIFMEESIVYQTALFQEMIKNGVFIEESPKVMAMNFYTPIFFLLSKYSGSVGKEEEALKNLDEQIVEFYRIYKK